jgi:hypothetical protein
MLRLARPHVPKTPLVQGHPGGAGAKLVLCVPFQNHLFLEQRISYFGTPEISYLAGVPRSDFWNSVLSYGEKAA